MKSWMYELESITLQRVRCQVPYHVIMTASSSWSRFFVWIHEVFCVCISAIFHLYNMCHLRFHGIFKPNLHLSRSEEKDKIAVAFFFSGLHFSQSAVCDMKVFLCTAQLLDRSSGRFLPIMAQVHCARARYEFLPNITCTFSSGTTLLHQEQCICLKIIFMYWSNYLFTFCFSFLLKSEDMEVCVKPDLQVQSNVLLG